MAEIKVPTVKLELHSMKLTPKLWKQLPKMTYEEVKHILKGGDIDPAYVVGWVHGAAVGDEWNRYLLICLGEGLYGKFECMESTCKKFTQIYLS